MPGYLVPTNTVDQSTTIGGYNVFEAVNAGAVLQVVSSTHTSPLAVTTDTDILSTTIVPSSTSSKILIIASLEMVHRDYYTGHAFLLRNGSNISPAVPNGSAVLSLFSSRSSVGGGSLSSTIYSTETSSKTFLDSPSSISSLTYLIRVTTTDPSQPTWINRSGADDGNSYTNRGFSTLTLMEIAG